jgi:outer membrane protein assembly factor BamB
VYALNAATGALKWISTDSTVNYEAAPQPTVSHGIVFSGSYMHDLSAYDARSGAVKWVFKTSGPVYSGPCVVDVDNKIAYPGESGHKN